MKRLAASLTATVFSLGSPAFSQVLPPPALPGQEDLGRDLVADFARNDVAAYSGLLSTSVHVYDEGLLARMNGCASSGRNSLPKE